METEIRIDEPMTDEAFWREFRRALLMIVALIDRRYGFKQSRRSWAEAGAESEQPNRV